MNKATVDGIVTGKVNVDAVWVRVEGFDEPFECYTTRLIKSGTKVKVVIDRASMSGYIYE